MIGAGGCCRSACAADLEVDGQRASITSSDSEGSETAAVEMRLSPAAGAEDDNAELTNLEATQLSARSSSSCPSQFSPFVRLSVSVFTLFVQLSGVFKGTLGNGPQRFSGA